MKNIQHEITPINEDDLFIILNHPKADFDYPIHFHSDFELNLVLWDFWTPHCRRFHRTFRRGRFSTDWSQCSTQMGRQQCREQPCHHYTISRTAPNIPHSSKTHVLLDKRYVGKIEKRNPIHRKQKFRYCQKNNRHDSNDGIQRLSRILCPTL